MELLFVVLRYAFAFFGAMLMRHRNFVLIPSLIGFMFFFNTGCEEQAAKPQSQSSGSIGINQLTAQMRQLSAVSPSASAGRNSSQISPQIATEGPSPTITFDQLTYDLGNISSNKSQTCEFVFTNTGDTILEIQTIESSCTCTVPTLNKNEYAPGERGTIRAIFQPDAIPGRQKQTLSVASNDRVNPLVVLSLMATVIEKVDCTPKELELSLIKANGGCPNIKVTCSDNLPFAITSFKSTNGCITAEYNSSIRSTQFVLQPVVDMQKLEFVSEGIFQIGLTHPDCSIVQGTFSALKRFEAKPSLLTFQQDSARESTTRKVRIVSNYNEAVNIESLTFTNNTFEVIDTREIQNGYELELKMAPQSNGDTKVLDVLSVKLANGQTLRVTCNGRYNRIASQETEEEEECKTCHPWIIDFR